jgi:hypothetical protein
MRIRSSEMERAKDVQRLPSGFEAALGAARKKKPGGSVNDKLTATAATIEQVLTTQKEMTGSQKAFRDSDKAILYWTAIKS